MSIRDARIRDRRRRSWFSCDNEIVDDYGPKLGVYGLGVYCVLSRYANSETEEATVSLKTLAKKLKVGPAKLLQTLDALETVGLISIERGDREHSNIYTLLEVPKRGTSDQKYPHFSSEVPPTSDQKRNKRSVSQNYPKGITQSKEEDPYDLGEYLRSKVQ